MDIDEIRTRLAVAEADAQKAIAEAAMIGRLLINDRLAGPFTDASVQSMADRLEVLRHAVHDLESAHAALRKLARCAAAKPAAEEPAGEPAATSPTDAPRACASCGRADTLAQVRISTICSGLGAEESRRARWISPR